MLDTFVNIDISSLKPKCTTVKTISQLKIEKDATIQTKADGEFSLIVYTDGESFMINKWKRLRAEYPQLIELSNALRKLGVKRVEFLGELYAVDEKGRPMKLPDFIRIVKSGDKSLIEKHIRIGIFDLLKIDGHEIRQSHAFKMQEVENWLKGCRLVHVLPYIVPRNRKQIQEFWRNYVVEKGFEGIVYRDNSQIIKVKPYLEADFVIIGLNKRKMIEQQQVRSLKIALMTKDGKILDVGDVSSGIDEKLGFALWKLMEFKVGEDKDTIYIKPLIVVNVAFASLFKARKRLLEFNGKCYTEVGEMDFVSLRHPRLIRFREDKGVNPNDLRLEQIPFLFG